MASPFNIQFLRRSGFNDHQIVENAYKFATSIELEKNYSNLCILCDQIAWSVRLNDPLACQLLPLIKGFQDYPIEGHHGNRLIYVAGAKPKLLAQYLNTVNLSKTGLQKLATILVSRKDMPALAVVVPKIIRYDNSSPKKTSPPPRTHYNSYKEALLLGK